MAKSNEEVRDNDKDTLMEVRGIIDGVLDSGSTDYKSALNDISDILINGASDKVPDGLEAY